MKLEKVVKVVVSIAVILVLLAVVGVFVGYLNNGQKSFYLQSGSEKIYKDVDSFEFSSTEYNVFYVKSVLSLFDEKSSEVDYTVKVVLNPAVFASKGYKSYVVDDHICSISAIDLTEFFDLERDGNRFLFKIDTQVTLSSLLTRYHQAESILDVPDVDLYSATYLTLIVTNNADDTSIKLGIVGGAANE